MVYKYFVYMFIFVLSSAVFAESGNGRKLEVKFDQIEFDHQNNWNANVKTNILLSSVGSKKIVYFNQIKEATNHEAPNSRAILIVPGRGQSSIVFSELVAKLPSDKYDIFLIDHRGQGFSDRLITEHDGGYVDNFDDYVNDLKKLIDIKMNAYQGITLLAHSMGGAISMRYLQKYGSNRIDQVIMSNPMLEINYGVKEFVVKGLLLLKDEKAYASGGAYQPKKFEENDLTNNYQLHQYAIKLRERFPKIKVGSATAKWLSEAIDKTTQIRSSEELSKINIPISLFISENDTVVVGKTSLDICSDLNHNGKSCQACVYEGAKHEILDEIDEVRKDVLANILLALDNQPLACQ